MRAFFRLSLAIGLSTFASSVIAQEKPSPSPNEPTNGVVLLQEFAAGGKDNGPEVSESLKKQGVFLDQSREIPAGAEWNREIVAKKPGKVRIAIKSDDPKGLIILTSSAFKNMMAGKPNLVDRKKDVILVDDTKKEIYQKDIDVPAGSYMLMIENRSKKAQKFFLRCTALDSASAAAK